MTIPARLRGLPPWAWVAVVAVAGVGALMWHQYRTNDDDTSWLDVDQPPVAADFPSRPPVGPAHGAGRPLDIVVGAFRSRTFPPQFDLSLGFGLKGCDGC